MNRKLLPTLCCALLCTFAGLFLSSCATPAPPPVSLVVDYGPASMKRHQVVQTAQKIKEQKPTSLQQLCAILGAQPQGTHSDKQGKYCFWQAYEQSTDGTFQQSRIIGLVDKKDTIMKLCVGYFPRPFESKGGRERLFMMVMPNCRTKNCIPAG